ncbi:alpha/beta fold hydrolase [Cellulomonas sp.]|uniref:alpha/beta fold hydrolase n=1 Tax=Cellulomonas sp. TaxID=40001 RepID=UPI002D6572C9|nr:alpha/beta fold hydrolase [Cellulomonas sp.]HYQ74836.1 alpha/beta fold hydrolase [Cellulomonas sp.]
MDATGLHVADAGSGPVVLLLHGNGEDGASLAPVAADLARDHRVLSPDARGHGRSPRGTGPLTITRLADDAAGVLAGAGAGAGQGAGAGAAPADVVGYSDGGNVGLLLALWHPAAVRSLVVYGANVDPAGLTARSRAEVTAAWLGLRARGLVDPAARARAEVTDLMVRQPRIPLRALERVRVPVLVAAGEHDVVRRAHTEAVAAALPAGECVVVPGADHGLPLADPAAFVRLVRDFWAAHGS